MVLSGPPAQSIRIFLANLTMFQAFMGIPHLMALYWTLTLELLFYMLLSLLFLLKLNTRISYATLALIVISIGAELVIPLPFAFSYSTHLLLILVGPWPIGTIAVRFARLSGCGALLTPLMLVIPLLVDSRDFMSSYLGGGATGGLCMLWVAYLLRARPVHPILRYFRKDQLLDLLDAHVRAGFIPQLQLLH